MQRYNNRIQVYLSDSMRNYEAFCFAKWGTSTAGQFGISRLFTGGAEQLFLGCVVNLFGCTYGEEIGSQRLA